METVNLTESYLTSTGQRITDNSLNPSNKFSPYSFTPRLPLPLGTYRITLTGKDNAGNTGPEAVFTITVTTFANILTQEEKDIVRQELKKESPEVQNKVEEELEITKPDLAPPKEEISSRKFKFPNLARPVGSAAGKIAGSIETTSKNIASYIRESAKYGGKTIGSGLKHPQELASGIGGWIAYSAVSFREIVLDQEPTTITSVKVEKATPTTAIIYWQTNHLATSKVSYGTTLDYGKDAQSNLKTHEHRITITGLAPGQKYFYEVMSQNKNYVYDAHHEFSTPER